MNERPLKFRIYSYTDKLWHYFDIYEGYPQGIYGSITPPMQFTGFIDRNGKEIYEGDLLDSDHTLNSLFLRASVEFKYGCFSETKFGYSLKTLAEEYYMSYKLDRYSVVGNIIENKELLEK